MTPGDSNGEGGEARPFRAESITKRTIKAVIGAASIALLLAGCANTHQTASAHYAHQSSATSTTPSTAQAPPAVGAAPLVSPPASTTPPSARYTLVQEPQAGEAPIYALITKAQHTVEMTMYELNDSTAEADLIADAHRGVQVRVLLDKDYTGGKVNQAAYNRLTSGGVQVRWALANTIFHQKTISVDGDVSAIGTGNLTSQYYTTSRDAWIITTNTADVSDIIATFNEDWAGEPGPPAGVPGPGLVWSPGAQSSVVNLIDSAKNDIYFESEEISDYAVVDALEADAHRGVQCDIVMTYQQQWATNLTALENAGCAVRVYPDTSNGLYIHEKMIMINTGSPLEQLLIGSQNASVASLQYNRELSLLLNEDDAPEVLNEVAATFQSDFAGGTILSQEHSS